MEKRKTSMNWNTLLLTANLAVLGWGGQKLFEEVRITHDAVVGLNYQYLELKTRLSALELDWQKYKDRHPL